MENNELSEDNSALEAQIKKLQSELDERIQPKQSWISCPSQLDHNSTTPQLQEDHLMFPATDHASQTAPVMAPVFVVPLHQDLQAFPQPDAAASNVSRPHARYPSPSDSWSTQILASQLKKHEQHELRGGASSGTSCRGD